MNNTIRATSKVFLASALLLNGCYSAPDAEETAATSQSSMGGPIDTDPCAFLPARPDLVVDSFVVQNINGLARLRAVIRNRGCAVADYMPYAIVVTLPGASSYGATWAPTSVAALEPNWTIARGAVLTFESDTGWAYATLKAQGGTWRVEADGLNHLTEIYESNNVSMFPN